MGVDKILLLKNVPNDMDTVGNVPNELDVNPEYINNGVFAVDSLIIVKHFCLCFFVFCGMCEN